MQHNEKESMTINAAVLTCPGQQGKSSGNTPAAVCTNGANSAAVMSFIVGPLLAARITCRRCTGTGMLSTIFVYTRRWPYQVATGIVSWAWSTCKGRRQQGLAHGWMTAWC